MTIYFVRSGEHGPVKIGFAVSCTVRLAELQCGNPEQLYLVRQIRGERLHEAWFHTQFAHLRIRGEWFHFDEAMMTLCPPSNLMDGQRIWRSPELTGAISRAGGVRGLARQLNVSYQAVANWSDLPPGTVVRAARDVSAA
jgi:hypothetical protein